MTPRTTSATPLTMSAEREAACVGRFGSVGCREEYGASLLTELFAERAAHAETARERDAEKAYRIGGEHAIAACNVTIAARAAEVAELREALGCLLPGLVLDVRYADDDDDIEAMWSRVKTVTAALSHSPGSHDALRAMLDRCVSDCLAGMNETGIFPDAHKIVTRILSGGAA